MEGLQTMFHLGTPLTFLGAQVSCRACKSTGVIVAEGPRFDFDRLTGKQMALDKDRCACKCIPMPYMIASQSTMVINTDNIADSASTQAPLSAEQAKESPHWIAFQANDLGNCEGLDCIAHFTDGTQALGKFGADNTVYFARGSDAVCEKLSLKSETESGGDSIFTALNSTFGSSS